LGIIQGFHLSAVSIQKSLKVLSVVKAHFKPDIAAEDLLTTHDTKTPVMAPATEERRIIGGGGFYEAISTK
jgi:hypothetical protein